MPDNSIGAASAGVQQFDISRQREQQQVSEDQNTTSTENTRTQQSAASAGVEVELSQEAQDLNLATTQQVAAPANSGQTEPAADSVEAVSQTPAQETETPEPSQPPARENESQVTRQFDQSANEALGTVIDIRS